MLEPIFQQPGTKIFLQTKDKGYSYSWLQQKLKKTAGLFKDLNLNQGDRLFLAVSDEVDMSALFLASLVCGVVVIIGDPDMKSPRAKAIITRSNPACIIADKASLERWQSELPESCKVLPYIKEKAAKPGLLSKFLKKETTESSSTDIIGLLEKATAIEILPSELPTDALAYIIFTSGTTAESKGVAISRENLSAHLATLKKVYNLDESGNLLNQLLLHHADGCIQGPVLAAYTGCTWHRPSRFSIEKIPELLDYCYANNISHALMVPAMLNMLVQFADGYEDSFLYPEFKALISVSAHLEAPLWDKFEDLFKMKISNVFGLTETVAGSLFSGPSTGTYKKYTVGKPVDCEIRIVDENFVETEHGAGELCLRGKHIMKGYWRDEVLTAEAFKDGWFFTGDLAKKDADGYVTIVGRKKNLVISGGINIQPEEVTECLLSHPAISEACAVGMPDEVFGERLVAAVVLKPNAVTNAMELVEYCRQLLDDKKVPTKIFILPELPKGASGKVELNTLKQSLQQVQPAKQQTNGQSLGRVLAIAAEAFQIPAERLSIKDTSNTVGGWDSLAHLSFVTALEEQFNTRFTTAEIITMNSIQKAVHLVEKKQSSANHS
ncbi:MAG: AMP-binding protein [Bacteroidota bacterium]